MICKGVFKFKGLEKKDAGEFVNEKGQQIKYNGFYTLKVDEMGENGIYERRFRIKTTDNIIIAKMQKL